MPCACNIVAHDECVPELAGVLGVDCDAQKWTVQGADDWELVFPACSEEQEAELAADGDCVVCMSGADCRKDISWMFIDFVRVAFVGRDVVVFVFA